MRLKPGSGSLRWPPMKTAVLRALPTLLLAAQNAVVAQTETVRVEVTFVERIEVAQASPTQPDRAQVVNDALESEPPGSDATADQAVVTVLSILATPGRALTLHVGTREAPNATSFLCTYGSVRQAECGGAGVAAVSVAEAELTVDRGAQRADATALGTKDRTDIEVTITYQ